MPEYSHGRLIAALVVVVCVAVMAAQGALSLDLGLIAALGVSRILP